jgi:hypothetical protein
LGDGVKEGTSCTMFERGDRDLIIELAEREVVEREAEEDA